MRRPKKLIVGRVRARVIRGPHRDGSGRWYWRAEVNESGSTRTVWSGWEHRDTIEAMMVDLVARNALESSSPKETVETIQDLMECWVGSQKKRADLAPDSYRNYKSRGHRIVPIIGDVKLDRIDVTTIERFRDVRLRQGDAASTVKQDLKALRAAWRWGRELGFCPMKDLPTIRLKAKSVREKYTPPIDDIIAVLHELDGWPRLALRLLFATGARVGEISELQWKHIDFNSQNPSITLRGKTGKRCMPILSEVMTALADCRDDAPDDAGIFGVSPKMVRSRLGPKYLARACENAGVKRFTPHGLRRAAVDALQRQGVDIGTAAELLGHSPQVMLQYYRQSTMEDRRRAIAMTRLGSLDTGAVIPFPKTRTSDPHK